MIYMNLNFMGNITFGYLPSRKAIAEDGYLRLMKLLDNYPEFRSHIYPSSRTGLILRDEYPVVFQKIQEAVKDERVKIEFNGFEHAPFSGLSPDSTMRQIDRGVEVDLELWGSSPGGYWPSDCRWDPFAGYLLGRKGLKWIFLNDGALRTSNPGGEFYADWRTLDMLRPITVKCPGAIKIPGIFYRNNNYELFFEKDSEKFFGDLEKIHKERKEDACVTIGLDFELMLVLEYKGIFKDSTPVLEAFFDRLRRLDFVKFAFNNEILKIIPPVQEAFLRQTYWGHYGGASPDGAQKIIGLCDAAERDVLFCENIFALMPTGWRESEKVYKKIKSIWDSILLAENSEVRFTDPESAPESHTFYPKENVTLETFDYAIDAFESAAELKREMFKAYHELCGGRMIEAESGIIK